MRIKFIITSLLIVSCNSSNDFTINGSIDADDGSKVYILQADQNNQPYIKDSTIIKNSKFKFTGEAATPEISYFQVEGVNGYVLSIIESGKINAKIFKDSITTSLVTGTKSNNDFNKYRSQTKSLVQDINQIAYEQQEAIFNNDLELASKLRKDISQKEREVMLYEWDFIINNKDSYMSALLLEVFMVENKVNKDSIIEVFNTFSNRIKISNVGKNIADLLRQYEDPINVGELAPDFTAPSLDGGNITLSENLGKVTLIDFWAAWCRPCRVENPNLVKLYKKYSSSGLQIVGVSLDRTKEQWEKAVSDDNLPWIHVSNLNFWNDPIARQYSIRAIPQSFLLDENGYVIAKNLRGLSLDQKVESALSLNK
ncbi:MAG: TlpA disulfide reductase family protein [Bacteroidota bacterium]|nr:TlpA disulfide reductase family protein [Bacteroidota bacterium]|tara:strand:- start:1085 stop:2191 length:1107 start_codon:yes stop_codon:yes gene_type:complete